MDGAGYDGFRLGGVVEPSRNRSLADCLMQQVRRSAQALRPLLVLTDGWNAYPNSIRRAFREKVKLAGGVGRARLQVWAELHIGTVMKRTEKKRVVEVTRKMAHGVIAQAERLATLTRKSRHAARRLFALSAGMYLIGCSYNFCFPHHELSKTNQVGFPCTPAMAAGLTDHIWSFCELLSYRIAPPPWAEPKRLEQPPAQVETVVPVEMRPLIRLRQGVLCSTTV